MLSARTSTPKIAASVGILAAVCVLVFCPLTRNANLIKECLWWIGILGVLAAWLRTGPTCWRQPKALRVSILFLVLFQILNAWRSPALLAGLIDVGRLTGFVIGFWLMSQCIRAGDWDRFINPVKLACALSAGYVVCQALGWDVLEWAETARPSGTFANPNFSANCLAALIPLVALAPLMLPGRKVGNLLLLGLMSVAVVLTRSRSGLLGLLVGIGTLLALELARSRREGNLHRVRAIMRVAVGSVLACSLVLAVFLRVNPAKLSHFASSETVALRIEIWRGCVSLFLEKTLLGWGTGAFGVADQKINWRAEHITNQNSVDHAHSWIMELLVEHGIVGTALWFVFLGSLAISFLKAIFRAPVSADAVRVQAVVAALAALLAATAVDVWLDWWDGAWIFWLLAGAGMGLQGEVGDQGEVRPVPRARILAAIAFTGCIATAACAGSVFVSEILMQQAGRMRQQKEFASASRTIGRALRCPVHSPEVYFEAARVEFGAGRTEEALALLGEMERFQPASAREEVFRGFIQQRLHQPERALQHMRRAAELEPSGLRKLALAEALIASGDREEAAQLMKDHLAESIHPPMLARYLRLELEMGRGMEAREFLMKLRDNGSGYRKAELRWRLHQLEAELSMALGDWGLALGSYGAALTHDPGNHQSWGGRAAAAEKLQLWDRADRFHLLACAHAPADDPGPSLDLAAFLIRRGERDRAREVLQRAAQKPLTPDARRRLQALRLLVGT